MGRKRKELSTDVRKLIIDSYQNNGNISYLARSLGIPRSTIKSVIKKFETYGHVENRSGRGRKQLFTDRAKNQLSRIVKDNRRRILNDITSIFNEGRDHKFCSRTVREKIKDLGYNRRVAKKKVPIRDVNKKGRVRWCKERKNWTVDEHWRKWIFSDESQIVIGQNNKIRR
jgi:transposase